MESTKTTFYLANQLRNRLKSVAIAQGKSLTDLLAEGAKLVLERYEQRADREELKRRAQAARERMRTILTSSPPP